MNIAEFTFHSGKTGVIFDTGFSEIFNIYAKEDKIILIDESVYSFYSRSFPNIPMVIIRHGEQSKSLENFSQITHKLIEYNANKSTVLIGIGGGVVCDITGFTASTFMRGMRHSFIPTTLLAMADAAIGGKTALNQDALKNIIGTVKHPEYVLIDTSFIHTLQGIEIKNGFVEIIKSAILSGGEFFDIVRKFDFTNFRQASVNDLIKRSIEFKLNIVQQDEIDSGVRKILNLGHTLGHSIEAAYGLPHGIAVSYGLKFATVLSTHKQLINQEQASFILEPLLNLNIIKKTDFDPVKLMKFIRHDKKGIGNEIDYILLEDIGKPLITKMQINEIQQLTENMRNNW